MKKQIGIIVMVVVICACVWGLVFYFVGLQNGQNTPHKHALEYTAGERGSCTENGRREYWKCSTCGKYFSDADGMHETTPEQLIIAAGHRLRSVWTTGGGQHWHQCLFCDEKIDLADCSYSHGRCTVCGQLQPVASNVESVRYVLTSAIYENAPTHAIVFCGLNRITL